MPDAHAAAVEAVAAALHVHLSTHHGDGCLACPCSAGDADLARGALAALTSSEAVRATLAESKTWPCSLCRGTGTFEYDDDCGDSTCGAPHLTKRVRCGTCRGERFTTVGTTAADAILAALAAPEPS